MIWGFNYKYLPHVVAIKAMNKVASHINEMQKLHEEYGAVFDQLINEQTADKKEVEHINVSALSPVNDPVTYLLFFLTWFFFLLYASQVADLSMGDLLLHSTVAWINPQTSLAKSKKDPDLAAFGTVLCRFYHLKFRLPGIPPYITQRYTYNMTESP